MNQAAPTTWQTPPPGPLPPPVPRQARRNAVLAVAANGVAATALGAATVGGLGALGAPMWGVTVLAMALGAVIVEAIEAHYQRARRRVHHADRWHREPLYRARWGHQQ